MARTTKAVEERAAAAEDVGGADMVVEDEDTGE
jgi:hypothetical protein